MAAGAVVSLGIHHLSGRLLPASMVEPFLMIDFTTALPFLIGCGMGVAILCSSWSGRRMISVTDGNYSGRSRRSIKAENIIMGHNYNNDSNSEMIISAILFTAIVFLNERLIPENGIDLSTIILGPLSVFLSVKLVTHAVKAAVEAERP